MKKCNNKNCKRFGLKLPLSEFYIDNRNGRVRSQCKRMHEFTKKRKI